MQVGADNAGILYKWARYNNFFSLPEMLTKNGVRDIAIWGGGTMGTLIYEVLYKTDVECSYIIDNNPDLAFKYDVPIIPECDIQKQHKVDLVIVTVNKGIATTYIEMLLLDCGIEYISLDDLLMDIDENILFGEVVNHINNCNAKLLLLDMYHPLIHKNPSTYEKMLLLSQMHINNYRGNTDVLLNHYDDIECADKEYIEKVIFDMPVNLIKKNDVTYLDDVSSKFFNVVNNCRVTIGQPETYEKAIHLFGCCVAVGLYEEDSRTVASILQKKINDCSGENWRVVNRGNLQGKLDSYKQIIQTNYAPGDVVILITNKTKGYSYYYDNLSWYNFSTTFDRPHKYEEKEFFFDMNHINHRGYDLISDRIYDLLKRDTDRIPITSKFKIKSMNISNTDRTDDYANKDLEAYIQYLQQEKVCGKCNIGAIVMNCNPFTLGHRYLIEKALECSDFIYIFVVEENRSAFAFSDRYAMVKAGVEDLDNVKVLRSGSYIISTETFPEYFIKEKKDVIINATYDLTIFAEKIAPVLNITKRFVGEEPLCNVTRQYNCAMKEVLPAKGIDVVEIPRQVSGNEPISASRVRKLIDSGDYVGLKELVPESTLEYIKKNCCVI